MESAQLVLNKLVQYLVNPALAILFAFGLLIFVYGLVEFMWKLSKGADTTDSKSHMLWGTVGMFIMVSVFGIIRLISGTFGLGIGAGGTYTPNTSIFDRMENSSFGL